MKSLYAIILVLSLTFASCDSPTDNKSTKKKPKPAYSFAFATKEGDHKVKFTVGSYPYPVVAKHKPTTDKREITYSSSDETIATVDKGTVTFVTAGTVIITAKKAAEGAYEEVSDTYTLYITMKPANTGELVAEIQEVTKPELRGMGADLNYIDTSAIEDMEGLFAGWSHGHRGYDLYEFAGDISKWDVSNVIHMHSMFAGATKFNSDISNWNVSKVTNMDSMFFGARVFNRDISKWNVSKVMDMSSMFRGATEFTWNLDTWADKINKVKNNDWSIDRMFFNSGLKDSLPIWCKTVKECKDRQE